LGLSAGRALVSPFSSCVPGIVRAEARAVRGRGGLQPVLGQQVRWRRAAPDAARSSSKWSGGARSQQRSQRWRRQAEQPATPASRCGAQRQARQQAGQQAAAQQGLSPGPGRTATGPGGAGRHVRQSAAQAGLSGSPLGRGNSPARAHTQARQGKQARGPTARGVDFKAQFALSLALVN
jgi:hypothetical protein